MRSRYTAENRKEGKMKKVNVAKSGSSKGDRKTVRKARPKGKEPIKPKRPDVTKGAASLIFFYFGEKDYIKTLGQETMELYRAMEDYEYVVLLKHRRKIGKFELSQRAVKKANKVDKPTTDNLIKYIKELAQDGYMIDIWIFSHGWKGGFRASTGNDRSQGECKMSDLEKGLSSDKTGFTKMPIRLVYQVNCHGGYKDMRLAWRNLGAKVVFGARSVNFFPYEFSRFAIQWNKGKKAGDCRDYSCSKTPTSPTELFCIPNNAHTNRKKWDPNGKNEKGYYGCVRGYNVLGTKKKALECGKKYFTASISNGGWGVKWKKNGKTTMKYASWKLGGGDYSITQKTKPTW